MGDVHPRVAGTRAQRGRHILGMEHQGQPGTCL